jgi:predicted RNase H-like HicB family nuclease
MKKLLSVEDIKIEKGDIGFFAHIPEELGLEGNMLRADTKEELERLIKEYVEEYNKKLVSTKKYENSGLSL